MTLIYHQANDLYHYLFRILRILNCLQGEIDFNLVKLIDFYCMFPTLIETIQMDPIRPLKKEVKELDDRYMHVANKKRQFANMNVLYNQAAELLLQLEVVQKRSNVLTLSKNSPHPELLEFAGKHAINPLSQKIIEVFVTVRLEGKGGLKDRSGIMEFRYDVS